MSTNFTDIATDPQALKEMIKHTMDNLAFAALDEMRAEVAAELLQIDELSSDTLKSYNKKAVAQLRKGVVTGDKALKRDDGVMGAQERIWKTGKHRRYGTR